MIPKRIKRHYDCFATRLEAFHGFHEVISNQAVPFVLTATPLYIVNLLLEEHTESELFNVDLEASRNIVL